MLNIKKLLLIPIVVIAGLFTRIDSSYAAGNCGIGSLDTSTNGRGSSYQGYTRLNGNAGSNESNYGLTTGSGQWAVEFDYGTVWGMAKCSETSGNSSNNATWPESSKSDWLKTPSDTNGRNCWCQATGFTATASSYTSGPQCTTTASSLWVFFLVNGSNCASGCAYYCANYVRAHPEFRAGVFGAVPADVLVDLAWYDNGTAMSGGPSSCTVGGTFLPPTPPARTGYIFAGWRVKEIHIPCVQQIQNLDTSINGSAGGYISLDGSGSSYASNFGLQSNGQWAAPFSYGTVWGMANCNSTNGGTAYTVGTPTLASSGRYCWCQVTGFTASGNSYTSGPQCTTAASSKWVFYGDQMMAMMCAQNCSQTCQNQAIFHEALREALYGAAE